MKYILLFILSISFCFAQTSIPTYGYYDVSGTNVYTATPSPAITYNKGATIKVRFTNANTTAATFNPNGIGAKDLVRADGTALSSGDIQAGFVTWLIYDLTSDKWKIMGGSGSGGAGTVTDVSIVTANGVSGSVATSTTTPAITLALGAITPTSVNGVAVSGSSSPALAVTGTSSISGTNTGDQTTVTGNAGTATALQTARTIGTITGDATSAGSSFDGTANNTNALTLSTVNSNVGSFGSSTQVGTFTVNGKGLITAASNTTITQAIGSVTGLGTGVSTALGVNTGSAGSFIVNAGSNGVLNANTNDIYYPSTTQTGTTYTVQSTDNHSTIRFTNSSPITVTLPNGLPTNFDVILKKMGTGSITVTATGTLSAPANTIQVQYTGAYFNHVGSNVWEGVGSLGASSLAINVGATTISNGTSGRFFFDNSGIVGEVPATGSGSVVLNTSPSLVTPALGTPTAVNLTNGTSLPLTTGVSGILPPANGGTGINNASKTITLGGNLTTIGAFNISFTAANNTAVTLPIVGTISTLSGTETFTNKTLTSPLINFGSDANGDIMVRQSGAYARLPIGSTNQTIRVVSGAVTWANPMVYSLFNDYTDASNTSTTETDLYSHTIAANTLNVDGNKLEVVFSGSFVTTSSNALSVGNKVAVYFAGTKIFDPGSGSSVSTEGGWRVTGTLIRSSSSVMRCTLAYTTEGTLVTKTVDVSSVDFTTTNILKITGQGAASSFITAKIGNITFNQ